MPKFPTFPTLFDECKTLDITFLKKQGFLEPNQVKGGTVTWSRNGQVTAKIGIRVNTISTPFCIHFDYTFNDEPVHYHAYLRAVPSNIGNGQILYFVCPQTDKLCRKLYLGYKFFYHRSAFKGCMYEKQSYSQKNRSLFKRYDKAFGSERAYELLYKKHFKKYYAGKPTKRYKKLSQIISVSEQFSIEDIERLYLA